MKNSYTVEIFAGFSKYQKMCF